MDADARIAQIRERHEHDLVQFEGVRKDGWIHEIIQDRGWLLARLAAQTLEIDATWTAIENGWDIEPRAYFEQEAPKNGFTFPLAQAIHHLWKRAVAVAAASGPWSDPK